MDMVTRELGKGAVGVLEEMVGKLSKGDAGADADVINAEVIEVAPAASADTGPQLEPVAVAAKADAPAE
jgi:hypothetical protein